jgi:hypothetical protein
MRFLKRREAEDGESIGTNQKGNVMKLEFVKLWLKQPIKAKTSGAVRPAIKKISANVQEHKPATKVADDAVDEMNGDSVTAQARRREQARCAAIFADAAAATRRDLAATLAFTTRLPRSQAIAILRSSPDGSASAAMTPLGAVMAAAGHGKTRRGLAPASYAPKQQADKRWDDAMKAAANQN